MKIVTGLFKHSQDVEEALSQLQRQRFVGKDIVSVINQERTSPADATEGGQPDTLYNSLLNLGIVAEEARLYAQKLQVNNTLVVVKTEDERASQAASILRQARADEWSIQQPH